MGRILLVDDDPTLLALEKLILVEEGHEVLTAADAKSAIQTLRFYDIDLVIADVSMPQIDGFKMVTMMRLEARNRALRVGFFTAKREKDDIVQAGKLQADFYLAKPVERTELLKKVEDLFRKHPSRFTSNNKRQSPGK